MYAFIIFLSFTFSAICAALIAKYGRKLSLIDKPGERSSHVLPTPRGGICTVRGIIVRDGQHFSLSHYVFVYILCRCNSNCFLPVAQRREFNEGSSKASVSISEQRIAIAALAGISSIFNNSTRFRIFSHLIL